MPIPQDPIKREEWRRKQSLSHKGHLPHSGGFKKGSIPWNKGIPMDDTTRLKVSMAKMGSIPWNSGKRTSREIIDKLRKSHIGQIPWNKGLACSQETRDKISKTLTGKKRGPFTKEHRQNMSAGRIGMTFSESHRNNISRVVREHYAQMTPSERRELARPLFEAGATIFQSSIEKAVINILREMNIPFETQKPFDSFFIDIFIPSKNLAIECNGEYWHRLPDRRVRDHILRRRCMEDGIKLVFLWENEIKHNAKEAVDKALRMAA